MSAKQVEYLQNVQSSVREVVKIHYDRTVRSSMDIVYIDNGGNYFHRRVEFDGTFQELDY